MILAVVYVIKILMEKYAGMKVVVLRIPGLVLLLFVLFYPAVSGLVVLSPHSFSQMAAFLVFLRQIN